MRMMKKQKIAQEGKSTYILKSNHLFTHFAPTLVFSDNCNTNDYETEAANLDHINPFNSKKKNQQSVLSGKKETRKQSDLQVFALELFKDLCEERGKKIKGEKLLESLVYLGIAADPLVIRKTLCLIFKCNSLGELVLDSSDFLEIFKSDPRTDKILKRLDEVSLTIKTAKTQKFQRTRDKVIYIDTASSLFTNKTSTKTSPRQNPATLIINPESKPDRNCTIAISDHFDLIKKWWSEFKSDIKDQAPIDQVCTLLVSNFIASDKKDAKQLIVSYTENKQNISFNEFQQIFAKSMLKAAFINLFKRLTDKNFVDSDVPSRLNLLKYKRNLFMSASKYPCLDISEEEGNIVMSAIEKYEKTMKKSEK